jgi:hypothetical protein
MAYFGAVGHYVCVSRSSPSFLRESVLQAIMPAYCSPPSPPLSGAVVGDAMEWASVVSADDAISVEVVVSGSVVACGDVV